MELELQNDKAEREFGAHLVHLLFVKLYLFCKMGKLSPKGKGLDQNGPESHLLCTEPCCVSPQESILKARERDILYRGCEETVFFNDKSFFDPHVIKRL